MSPLRTLAAGLVALGLSLALPAMAAKPAKTKPENDKATAPAKPDTAAPAGGVGTKWKVTVTMSMPGAPVPPPPPMTYEFCQTESARVPHQPTGPAGKCKMLEQKFENHKASWKVRCEGHMVMVGEGSITYDNDTFAGEIAMKGEGEGTAFSLTQKMSGQKIGTCKP